MTTPGLDKSLLASGDYLAVVRDFALAKGIDAHTLIQGSDIRLADLINPPRWVNNLLVNRVGSNLYRELENPLADAVEFGLSMTPATHGSLGVAVQCAPTLREAYKIMADYFNTRVNSIDIIPYQDSEYLTLRMVAKYKTLRLDQDVEFFFDFATFISIASNTLRFLDLSRLAGQIKLCVNHPEPENFPHRLLSERMRIAFNEDHLQLCIPITWMDQPLNPANPDLAKMALEKCQSELIQLSPTDLVDQVKQALGVLDSPLPSLETIAAEFHMSPATFKRRLSSHGTSYQNLKNEERMERARQLLMTGNHSVDDIAERLGFSDASNFTKAFKSWTGLTPRAYQQHHQEEQHQTQQQQQQ